MATPPLGRRLAALRTAAGVDQQELARRMGIKASQLCDYEKGRKNPSPEIVRRILHNLALPPRMLDSASRFLGEVEAAHRTLALPPGDARQEAEEMAELIAWGEALA